GPDGAGDVPAVTGQDVAAGLGHRAGAEAEQPQQIGVGTEAAVPDPDAPFGAEPGGDEAVVDPLDGEGGDRQGVIAGAGGGPEEPDTVDGGEAAAQQPGQVGLVGDDGRPADGGELGHGGAESDGADHVGGTGLLALWGLGPDDLVDVDQVDGAAAGQERVAVDEGRAGTDQGAGAVGGVELVAAERHEVGAGWQRAVGGELGGVKDDGDPAVMGGGADGVHRREPAGDVGGPGDGEEGRAPTVGHHLVEDPGDVVDAEGAVTVALHVAPIGHPTPRE